MCQEKQFVLSLRALRLRASLSFPRLGHGAEEQRSTGFRWGVHPIATGMGNAFKGRNGSRCRFGSKGFYAKGLCRRLESLLGEAVKPAQVGDAASRIHTGLGYEESRAGAEDSAYAKASADKAEKSKSVEAGEILVNKIANSVSWLHS
jgi:hypothetical protein